jgi:hypothetical protein
MSEKYFTIFFLGSKFNCIFHIYDDIVILSNVNTLVSNNEKYKFMQVYNILSNKYICGEILEIMGCLSFENVNDIIDGILTPKEARKLFWKHQKKQLKHILSQQKIKKNKYNCFL